jgi:ABC-type lipoprotein release transport system permease subunit
VGVHEFVGWKIPEVTITQSLAVIVSSLALATIASLVSTRKAAVTK